MSLSNSKEDKQLDADNVKSYVKNILFEDAELDAYFKTLTQARPYQW